MRCGKHWNSTDKNVEAFKDSDEMSVINCVWSLWEKRTRVDEQLGPLLGIVHGHFWESNVIANSQAKSYSRDVHNCKASAC